MRFRDCKNVYNLIDYCKQNKKWKKIDVPQNDFDVEIVFVYHSTPLLFATSSGDVYYMSEYTEKNFITMTTCWYLSSCKNKFTPLHKVQFKNIMQYLKIGVGML